MADGKWIPGLTANMRLLEAARRVLSARLETVHYFLPLAVETPDDDVEYVHQLRVGTRRARAALDLFELCLPKKRTKVVRRHLKEIRRAAGAARDWDVFQAELAAWAPKRAAEEQPGLDFVRGHAFSRRLDAQTALNGVDANGLDAAAILAEMRAPKHNSAPKRLLDLGMPLLLERFLSLHEALTAVNRDEEHLHRLRILGKRLRYAMEVFADCFAPPFRSELYPAVEEMQDILGQANDSRVTQEHLTEVRDRVQLARADDWPRLRLGFERYLQAQRRRLPQARQKFAQWREQWRARSLPLAESLLHVRLTPEIRLFPLPEAPCAPPSRAPSNGSAASTDSSG